MSKDNSSSDLEVCPSCATVLTDSPAIGLYCPNKECPVLDNISEAPVPRLVEVRTSNQWLSEIRDFLEEVAAHGKHAHTITAHRLLKQLPDETPQPASKDLNACSGGVCANGLYCAKHWNDRGVTIAEALLHTDETAAR